MLAGNHKSRARSFLDFRVVGRFNCLSHAVCLFVRYSKGQTKKTTPISAMKPPLITSHTPRSGQDLIAAAGSPTQRKAQRTLQPWRAPKFAHEY